MNMGNVQINDLDAIIIELDQFFYNVAGVKEVVFAFHFLGRGTWSGLQIIIVGQVVVGENLINGFTPNTTKIFVFKIYGVLPAIVTTMIAPCLIHRLFT